MPRAVTKGEWSRREGAREVGEDSGEDFTERTDTEEHVHTVHLLLQEPQITFLAESQRK